MSMLCQVCKQRPAKVHYTEIVNQSVVAMNLCVECAEERGIEVHKTSAAAKVKQKVKDDKGAEVEKQVDIPAGSHVIRMDQPYSRMADMLLDTQWYNVNDPRPYDDTGWTLGALHDVKTLRVGDPSLL